MIDFKACLFHLFSPLKCCLQCWLLCLFVPAAMAQSIDVGLFSRADIEGWQQKSFSGETRYQLKETAGVTVLQADSNQSASAFYRKIPVDLATTPVMHWRWRKLKTINPGDENKRAGDDFVARIYVVRDGGIRFWNTQAINYVWSYQHPQGAVWDNPFAGKRAKMVAQRDRQAPPQQWFEEQRNIVQDFKTLLNMDVDGIDGVAIMTDSDNSGSSASAQYGDIYFTSE